MSYNQLVTKWMSAQLESWIKTHKYPSAGAWATTELYLGAVALWQKDADAFKAKLWAREVEDRKASAYLKSIQDGEAAIIRKRIQVDDWEGMPELKEQADRLRAIKNRNGNGGALTSLFFVTVNVKPGVTHQELQSKIVGYAKRKMVTSCEWVLEQRGSTELEAGQGLHAHLIVRQRGDTFDGKFKVNTRNTFKHLVGIPERHVFITPMKEEFLEDKRAYMQGVKLQDGKLEKVEIDVLWRAQNNISAYYTHNNARVQAQSEQVGPSSSEEGEDDGGSTRSSSGSAGHEEELLQRELDV